MQALTLMIVYVVTTAMVQFIGFLVSEEVFRNVRLGTTLWSRPPSLEH